MKLFIAFIISILTLVSCKPEPTYNPFDSLFDINVSKLVADNCDTISAGCGYFNLSKKFGNYSVFYQFYMDDPEEILAKGIIIHLDTIALNVTVENLNDSLWSTIMALPFDTNIIDNVLLKYGLKRSVKCTDRLRSDVRPTLLIYKDSINNDYRFYMNIEVRENEMQAIRVYDYYMDKLHQFGSKAPKCN